MQDILERVDLLTLALAFVVSIGIYVAVDGLSRIGLLKGENARKSIHVLFGIFAASFPVFMNRTEIFIFHGMFFVAIVFLSLASQYVRNHPRTQNLKVGRFFGSLFDRYEDVRRWTIGQFLYPLSLMLVVLFFDDLLIYSFSVLVLALSDGFAAIIGKPFGERIYYVPGGYKSLIGSFTFFVITFTLMCVFLIIETEAGPIALIPAFVFSLVLTFTEGLIAGGFDNLVIPLMTAVLLNTI